jgi:hypothetical protein
MVFVFWFPSCDLSLDSYAIVSGACLEFVVVDTIWMVNINVVWFMCVANKGYKHRHESARQIPLMNNMGNI